MSLQKLPSGTRGTRQPPGWLAKIMKPVVMRMHRRQGDTFQGQNLLYLTTIGAKSGETRTNPVARFDDGGHSTGVRRSTGRRRSVFCV